ncbi:hypothetical protein H2198_007202 [Neophaeococcomyces mojaviensis]|uniref:Uncharacterized protein n=1 Tax=Neophaeococcomyces mojaviensis TaxID=3383035 RepID=A0ACC3A0S4_9EURO|nr:hypothetical protein H2198_007202 [Knufia sp. JES_112]
MFSSICTGCVGSVAGNEANVRSRPPPKEWYIPESFPYSHTHIDELKEWPQRLLHVPSMTSVEWQPGNIYGGHKEPQYRAISYTWGRWKLADGQQPETGLAVDLSSALPWQLPRINRNHFTVPEFRQVINDICRPLASNLPAVDFLWLDLVCIDQRRGPLASLEIGRQAAIFQNATGVAVWLSKTGKHAEDLKRLRWMLTNIVTLVHGLESDVMHVFRHGPPAKWQQIEILIRIRALLADPWFTSLWTLQEGYLSGEGHCELFFVFGDGNIFKLLPWQNEYSLGLFKLSSLTHLCRAMLVTCHTNAATTLKSDDDFKSFVNELDELVRVSGLLAMTSGGQHLSLLGVARHRFANEDTDRVYGIMQVFHCKLGVSRPGIDPMRYFDRQELEDQLGSALLEKFPLQSQLFVHTEPVERGRAWRLSSSSAVPVEFSFPLHRGDDLFNTGKYCQPHCKVTTQIASARTFGYFTGPVCWFYQLQYYWCRLQDLAKVDNRSGRPVGIVTKSVRIFFPDAMTVAGKAWGSPLNTGHTLRNNDPEQQNAFGHWLAAGYHWARLIVLHLGSSHKKQFGLILLHVQADEVLYWHRLGLVMWYWDENLVATEARLELMEPLTGQGSLWQTLSGLYG